MRRLIVMAGLVLCPILASTAASASSTPAPVPSVSISASTTPTPVPMRNGVKPPLGVVLSPKASCVVGYIVVADDSGSGYPLNANGKGSYLETGANTDYCWSVPISKDGPFKTESGLCAQYNSKNNGVFLNTCGGDTDTSQVWSSFPAGSGIYYFENEWAFNHGVGTIMAADGFSNSSSIYLTSTNSYLSYWARCNYC